MHSKDLLDLPPLPEDLIPPVRYRGEGHDLHVDQLPEDDRALVARLYGLLEGIYQVWREDPTGPNWSGIAEATDALVDPALRQATAGLGSGIPREGAAGIRAHEVLHDVRGGGLSAAMAEAELLHLLAPTREARVKEQATLQSIVYLARDHAKMMRNALRGIDPKGRRRDEEEKPHYISWLVERWDGHGYVTGSRRVHVSAGADGDAALSSCCLEAGAVDRVVYNHISNAARFTHDGRADLQIHHVSTRAVRCVISNTVSPEQESWLRTRLNEDSGALYRSGVTRGGQGQGLANAAYFVMSAFGLRQVSEGLDAGLIGGRLVDGRYVAWFHWPLFEVETGR